MSTDEYLQLNFFLNPRRSPCSPNWILKNWNSHGTKGSGFAISQVSFERLYLAVWYRCVSQRNKWIFRAYNVCHFLKWQYQNRGVNIEALVRRQHCSKSGIEKTVCFQKGRKDEIGRRSKYINFAVSKLC